MKGILPTELSQQLDRARIDSDRFDRRGADVAGTPEPLLRSSGLLHLHDFGLTGKGSSVGFVIKQNRVALLSPALALLKLSAPAVSTKIYRRSVPLMHYLPTLVSRNQFKKHSIVVLDADWSEVSSNNELSPSTTNMLRDYVVCWTISGAPLNAEIYLSGPSSQRGFFCSPNFLPLEAEGNQREFLRGSLHAALGCMLFEFIARAQGEESVLCNAKFVYEVLTSVSEARPHKVFPSAGPLRALDFARKLIEASSVKKSDRNHSEVKQMTAKELKQRRNECGLSVRRLARILGIEDDHLRQLERGEHPISDELGIRVIEALRSFPIIDNGEEQLAPYPDFESFDLHLATISRRDLKQKRQGCGLSVRAMAALLNVEQDMLRQIEHGEMPLSPDMAARALDIFDHYCSTPG